jgi:hypothetical protein
VSETKLKEACIHAAIALDATVNHLTGTNALVIACQAQCKHCKRFFNFVGNYDDTPNIHGPSITENKRMVILPMIPEAAPALIIPEVH